MKIRYTIATLAASSLVTHATTLIQYGFDFTSGTVASQNGGVVTDDSGNAHHGGVKFNTPVYSSNIPTGTQNVTGVGSLDVSGGHHTIASTQNDSDIFSISEMVANGGLTVEVWANQSNSGNGGNAKIIAIGGAFDIEMDSTGISTFVNSSGNGVASFTNALADRAGTWMHVAAVIDNFVVDGGSHDFDLKLYINGTLQDSVAYNDVTPSFALGRQIGIGSQAHSGSGDFRYDGLIYEPRISYGAVAPADFTIVVPEPASSVFLGLGGLALILRRRK
ncbi:PEP-CTERM sorting domain-containing protein [Verrucomicrobiaceae bacterium N1E253]|uniref:PEP-CTERM sorting domain-containing protein n=1 Tax=Oceaniferula marina TaxID=2748318 RepID=A0A851G9N1_9BACT|nr:LamG-like jellyroll fold domain-containing protein [Oceaniferula marina]NWK54126.1 PEP-CTERM sorting domain-containing protein [Oceaniferula marina]